MGEPEDSAAHPGTPDGFQRLWTPHRMVYIKGENKPASPEEHDCPFCAVQSREDRAGLIVHRGDLAYAVLNLYPYSPGHLLICPYRHVADFTELTDDEMAARRRTDPGGDAGNPGRQRAARLQPRHQPGRGRRRRNRRPPAPARGAALDRRRELPSRGRPDQGAAAAARPDLGGRTQQLGRLRRRRRPPDAGTLPRLVRHPARPDRPAADPARGLARSGHRSSAPSAWCSAR